MNTSDIENPKLGFESPESGDHFKNISFFEKIRKTTQPMKTPPSG